MKLRNSDINTNSSWSEGVEILCRLQKFPRRYDTDLIYLTFFLFISDSLFLRDLLYIM